MMLNRPQVWLVPVTLAGLFFSSCATAPRALPFNDAEFARYREPGTGVVTGRAFMTLRDRTIRVADNAPVDLEPATGYTTETRDRMWINGENLEPPDDRLSNYIQGVVSDNDGYFRFSHIAPGDYYVVCHALWRERFNSGESDQPWADHWQWLFARVSVKNGARIDISHWSQGHFMVH
jgi:hypothetical protein